MWFKLIVFSIILFYSWAFWNFITGRTAHQSLYISMSRWVNTCHLQSHLEYKASALCRNKVIKAKFVWVYEHTVQNRNFLNVFKITLYGWTTPTWPSSLGLLHINFSKLNYKLFYSGDIWRYFFGNFNKA